MSKLILSLILVSIPVSGSCKATDVGQHIMKVGDCARVKVVEITSRLVGIADSGSVIGFSNGVDLVSYSMEASIENSMVNDDIKVCRKEPEPGFYDVCQPLSDKQYWINLYTFYNYRTGDSYSGGNSTHICD